MDSIVFPKPLKHGDRIAVLSPASIVKPQYVYGAMEVLSRQGWEPYLGKYTLTGSGSYSGTPEQRIADFIEAFADTETRAIFCSRGGYGCVQLIESLNDIDISSDPKWLIGFSDVSVLHAFMLSKHVASIHAPMAKHLCETKGNDPYSQALFASLQGKSVLQKWDFHPFNHFGTTSGRIVGGNFAVLHSLINTSFDMLQGDVILFLEDIGENIYEVERMFWQLHLSGVLESLRGLIIGQFTEYKPDRNYNKMESMIHDMLKSYKLPVAFNAPIGHVYENIPIIEGACADLTITPEGTYLRCAGNI